MGDGENDILYELPFKLEGQRDLAVESMYEYGTRAGIWRMFRVFDAAGIPVTFFAAAVALERNPEVAEEARRARRRGGRPRLPLEQPLRDDARRGARGDPARGRVDHADDRLAAARLVLPRDERQHPRARRRGGRLRLRLRLLQRRPAVLDAGPRPAAPGRPVRPRRQRRALRRRRRASAAPTHFFETAKAHLDRLRNDGDDVLADDVDRPAPAHHRQPRAARTRSPASSTTRSRSATSGSRGASTSRTRSSSSSPPSGGREPR